MYSPDEPFLKKKNVSNRSMDLKCCIQMKTDDLEKVNEIVLLHNQVKTLSINYELGKQTFQKNMKKVFEHVAKTIKDASVGITKTTMETSEENNQALSNLSDKPSEIMNDRVILASNLLSSFF